LLADAGINMCLHLIQC